MPTSLARARGAGTARRQARACIRAWRGSRTSAELGVGQALAGARLLTGALAGLHLAAPRIRGLLSYVFLHGVAAAHRPRTGAASSPRFGRSGRLVLAGALLLNVMTEELPSGSRSSFGWFCTGLVLYAGLLAAVTAMGG